MKLSFKNIASVALIGLAVVAGAPRAAQAQSTVSFTGTLGNLPYAPVTIDNAGNLYGTTVFGGSAKFGNVWKIAAGTNTITTVASFNGTNGQYPYGGVTVDGNGNLYGTTYNGGTGYSGSGYPDPGTGNGVVWKIAAGTCTITPLAKFAGPNGVNPYAGVTIDSSGNLYGTTYKGGVNGCGVVWEIAAGTNTIVPLDSFSYSTTGFGSYGGVSFDANGNMYGTTSAGGASVGGTVWEIAAGTSTITTVANFTITTGKAPQCNVTIDSAGNLYGVTGQGGAGKRGSIWKIAAGTRSITTVASFNGSNGAYPYGGVLIGNDGSIYGTANSGGAKGYGVVWKVASCTSTITNLVTFNGSGNGSNPYSYLAADASGNLYGTASYGGSSTQGNVFKITNP